MLLVLHDKTYSCQPSQPTVKMLIYSEGHVNNWNVWKSLFSLSHVVRGWCAGVGSLSFMWDLVMEFRSWGLVATIVSSRAPGPENDFKVSVFIFLGDLQLCTQPHMFKSEDDTMLWAQWRRIRKDVWEVYTPKGSGLLAGFVWQGKEALWYWFHCSFHESNLKCQCSWGLT